MARALRGPTARGWVLEGGFGENFISGILQLSANLSQPINNKATAIFVRRLGYCSAVIGVQVIRLYKHCPWNSGQLVTDSFTAEMKHRKIPAGYDILTKVPYRPK